MVGIVAEEYQAVGLDFEVEATVYASVGLHAVAQLFGSAAIELCHRHSGNAVLNVDGNGLAQHHVGHVLDGRYEVEADATVLNAYVLCVEVALIAAIVIAAHTRLQGLLHLQVAVNNEGTAWLDKLAIVAETLKIGFLRSVDVEMVWVGRGNHAHPGT